MRGGFVEAIPHDDSKAEKAWRRELFNAVYRAERDRIRKLSDDLEGKCES